MIYQEYKSTFSHNGKNYDLNKIFKIAHNKRIKYIPISDFKWILKFVVLDKSRVQKANLEYPIIFVKENGKYIIVDGIHRLQKAINQNKKFIFAKRITQKELASTLIL